MLPSDTAPDWRRIRLEFPALAGRTFLNTATYGQTPRCAVEAVAKHFERRNSLACSDFLEWFDDMDGIRVLISQLIHSAPEDIAFVTNASTALSWMINGMEWQPGDRILTLSGEFPNNLYFPAMLSRLGVEFIETAWDRIDEFLDDRVRLVLISTVNYSSGFRPPLENFSARLREIGALLYVDGTQSLGALQFDVRTVQPDMFAVHAYKWLISPNGAGFAYLSKVLRERMRPTIVGWRSDRGWREVDDLHHGAPRFGAAAEGYEGGMLNFPSLYAMGASIGMILGIGPDIIEERVLALANRCSAVLEAAGGEIAHKRSNILAARFAAVEPSALAEHLRAQGIMVSARHGWLRVSPHFYNDEQDLDRLEKALAGQTL
jgi:selenocysteine lyase/cysteine desulfurase